MATRNKRGLTWRQHAAPYLKRALQAASRAWKPKRVRQAQSRKLLALRKKRDQIQTEIRKTKGQ